jgi:hypothetical protein
MMATESQEDRLLKIASRLGPDLLSLQGLRGERGSAGCSVSAAIWRRAIR